MDISRLDIDWPALGLKLCFGAGALFLGIALLWAGSHWLNAPAWVATDGQLVHARVTSDTRTVSRGGSSRSGGGGTRQQTFYSADIVYRYQAGGRDHIGIGIGDGENWNYETHAGAAAALARYTGGRLTVYYDPANPERSALDTNIFGIVPWILGGIGLACLGLGLWLRRRLRDQEAGQGM